jgi:hypothetical protein
MITGVAGLSARISPYRSSEITSRGEGKLAR